MTPKFSDQESQRNFNKGLIKFQKELAQALGEGSEFTVRLEIRGQAGKLLYARTQADDFYRNKEAKKG